MPIDCLSMVPPVDIRDLTSHRHEEPSRAIKERVTKARDIQQKRFAGRKIHANVQMSVRDIRKYCGHDTEAEKMLAAAH